MATPQCLPKARNPSAKGGLGYLPFGPQKVKTHHCCGKGREDCWISRKGSYGQNSKGTGLRKSTAEIMSGSGVHSGPAPYPGINDSRADRLCSAHFAAEPSPNKQQDTSEQNHAGRFRDSVELNVAAARPRVGGVGKSNR
jgi:hypothetical protein